MTDLLSQSMHLPDGRTLMYAEYGIPDGKPVFYFHGLSGSRLEPGLLDGNMLIEAGIHLIAPDRPGMGGSDFQPGAVSVTGRRMSSYSPIGWVWGNSAFWEFRAAAGMYLLVPS